MYRYFALIWDSSNQYAGAHARLIARRLQSTSAGWKRLVDESGLTAFHAGEGGLNATTREDVSSSETRLLPGGAGAVFGRVFSLGHELEPIAPDQPFAESEAASISVTAGEYLLHRYWGRYVAIIRDAERRAVAVLRDPTGGIPCFMTEQNGVQILFSEIGSCLSLGLLKFTINWKYIAAFVPYSALQISSTGLNEVTELQPGERIVFHREGMERTLLWRPADIVAGSRIESPVMAVAAVRETVKQCVHAWASLHRSVVHNLSGGLDSSIVLSCLKSAPNRPRVTCLHYFAPQTQEDEREYARLVARHMDVDLVECPVDPSVPLRGMLSIRPSPRPWFYIYDMVHSPIETRVMNEHGATALFTGSGGDGLFVQAHAELAIADYFRHHGMRRDVFRVAHDAARVNRTSIWPILYQGLRRHLKRPSRNAFAEFGDPRSLIPRDVYQAARNDDNLFHLWIREARKGLTPGQLWHILSLSIPLPYYESFGGLTELERTPVLMSQPLMELCLQIPSYVWISGGRDRAIARRAFADALPQAVVRRTQKGLIDRYNRSMLDENADFVREMLLDGLLVREGFLDREKLAACITAEGALTSYEYNEVLRQHLCTEIWLRRWTELTTSSAR